MHSIIMIVICYIIGIILSELIWRFTFGKQWLIREYGQDSLIWIGLFWPFSMIFYCTVMAAVLVIFIKRKYGRYNRTFEESDT